MRLLTKTLLGLGVAGATLLGAVAPATAAPTQPTAYDTAKAVAAEAGTMASYDRLVGPLHLVSGSQSAWALNAVDAEVAVRGVVSATRPANAGTYSIPAPGQTGPVVDIGTNRCIYPDDRPGTFLQHTYRWNCTVDTTGADLQWTTVERNGGYVLLPVGDSRGGMVLGAYDQLNQYRPEYLGLSSSPAIIDASLLTPVPADVEAAPVQITAPAAGEVVDTTTPVFEGTGEPGATIVVRDQDGKELCTTTVGDDGTWACTSTELPEGPASITVEQDADGETSTDTIDFTVGAGPSTPVLDPAIAGGATVLLAAAGLLWARRKHTATTHV